MSDASPNLKIYPSGFVGPADVTQSGAQTAAGLARSLMSRQIDINKQVYTSASEVDALTEALCDNNIRHNSFEFRERVLKLVMKMVFFDDAIQDLVDWATMQRAYGDYSDLHRRWVEETISFVELGKPRATRNESWLPILNAGTKDKVSLTLSRDLIDAIREEYAFRGHHPYRRDVILLCKWVNRPGGVFDMVNTLSVMYGYR